jgi:group I intron endonuclease
MDINVEIDNEIDKTITEMKNKVLINKNIKLNDKEINALINNKNNILKDNENIKLNDKEINALINNKNNILKDNEINTLNDKEINTLNDKENKAYIYKITNVVNGKVYIGETIRHYKDRWRQHKAFHLSSYSCPILKQAFMKYGIDNFKFEVIQECSFDERFELEKKYIEEYNSVAPKGYNFLPGGQGGGFLGKTHSDKTKEKISAAGKKFNEENPGYYETYREKHIEATKAAGISERMKNSEKFQKAVAEGRVGGAGNPPSEETKEKTRQSVLNYYSKLSEEKGIKHAVNIEKHRQVMAKAKGKKIGQFELNGITLIEKFQSINEASRKTTIPPSTIEAYASGKIKTPKNFIWKFLNDEC